MDKKVKILGFSKSVVGKPLEQILILDSPMGIAYERAIGFEKENHLHDRHMLVCPRKACRMQVSTRDGTIKIDSTQVLWMPMGLEHDDSSISVIYDTLVRTSITKKDSMA